MGIHLLADDETVFGVGMPLFEKMNLIEVSLLFTTKGTQVKYAEKRMNSWPAMSFFFLTFGKALSM